MNFKKMSNSIYEEIKPFKNEICTLTRLGLINPSLSRNLEVYELYLKHINKGCKVYESYYKVADEVQPNISWQSVKKIVAELSKKP